MSQNRRFNQRISAPDFIVPRGKVTRSNGLTVKKIATAVFDSAGTDSSGANNTTIAAHGTGVYIPDNAVITKVWYDVTAVFTSPATDAATIAIHVVGANDLLVANDINDGTDPFDAGLHTAIPGVPTLGADAAHDTALELGVLIAATWIKLSAEKEIIVTVAVQVLTLGKMVIYVEYTVSD